MPDSSMAPHRCQNLDVPADVCRLRFGTTVPRRGEHIGDTTRGEMLIAHYDEAGRIAELELVAEDKPCQVLDELTDEATVDHGGDAALPFDA
jgi:hypothetical protein